MHTAQAAAAKCTQLVVFAFMIAASNTLSKPVTEISASLRCQQPSHDCIRLSTAPVESPVARAKLQWAEGWSKLWVQTLPIVEPDLAMWAAGYLEGYIMKGEIQNMFNNTYGDWFLDPTLNTRASSVYAWLMENHEWTVRNARTSASPFWVQVRAVLAQLDGLAAGLQAAGSWLTTKDVIFLNADGDVEELVPLLASRRARRRDRCSAIIKLMQRNQDIFVGHSTWDHFDMMVRSLKSYDFNLRGRSRQTVTFSASPGFLASLDDFYLTSSGLAVLETSNGVHNTRLLSSISTASVLTWIRSMVANTLAADAPSWARLFSVANSGTYNNQWMILDLKLFTPGEKLSPATLIVLEQIPAYIEWHDVTQQLEEDGYWASYNIPAFPEISKRSGFDDTAHASAPRAKIFRQQQQYVSTFAEFQRLMRYNDWEHDPLSLGNPCNAISSRCDLNDITSPQWLLDGGIDAKATTVGAGMAMTFFAQSGPTADQQPAFSWLNVPKSMRLPHRGEPDTFNYSWIEFGPDVKDGSYLAISGLLSRINMNLERQWIWQLLAALGAGALVAGMRFFLIRSCKKPETQMVQPLLQA